MSVGGKVIEVLTLDEKIWINTDDGTCECAIYVERDANSEQVKSGDVVWWQGSRAFWTTKDRKTHIEKVLIRIGFSGVSRPLSKPKYSKEQIQAVKDFDAWVSRRHKLSGEFNWWLKEVSND